MVAARSERSPRAFSSGLGSRPAGRRGARGRACARARARPGRAGLRPRSVAGRWLCYARDPSGRRKLESGPDLGLGGVLLQETETCAGAQWVPGRREARGGRGGHVTELRAVRWGICPQDFGLGSHPTHFFLYLFLKKEVVIFVVKADVK